ncbi:NB-ARC domain-containing protein [Streptomyces sp. Amel2xB2]|uniref:ATP-binding protein n=1 Tax=Streptomyces sp. Amel2xB2 TaxID=1305829 RepID=UPI000DBFFFEA|nr:tetratricopeptide repeat protein [Streptomyces sp. Amel2xB2]RAJ61816.1 NB-ARC domain-containing protein [Streptomyces sp. Amel2xB2]
MQAGHVSGGVHFHGGHGEPGAAHGQPPPRQLPGDLRHFVNRTAELQSLDATLTTGGDPFVPPVCVIAGTAGAGKTALALRWAHQVKDRFPDGQLYVNLRGYDPGEPVSAEEVLPRFLTALGVTASAVPADTDSAAALYRTLLAERRMLVFLDNAATVAQVRPLLPGNARCLTIVTSRSRLSSLAVRDGADRLTLGTLDEPEAVALLRTVTAGHRAEDDAAKLAELARLCAHLPLALRIAAERAATHPHMSLDELITDLCDESALWDALSTGDEEGGEAVRAVFAWSYRALSPEAARLFRLLGLHPGPQFALGAVAALAGVSVRRARQLLDVLVGAHLLEQTAPDRFEFHDLLRAYAGDQAQQEESEQGRDEALRRVLDWYLHTADAAQGWIKPHERRLPSQPPADGVTPVSFADYDQAVDWAEREHANFLPAVRAAANAGLDAHAWQLAAVLWNAKAPSSLTSDWLPIGHAGLEAARRTGDRAAQARLLESFGFGYTKLSRIEEAQQAHEEALTVRRETGDRAGEANSLNALGLVHLRKRELGRAEARLGEASALFAESGETRRQTVTLANLALVRFRAGELEQAAEDIERALATHRQREDARSTGNALWILSGIQLERGEPQEALDSAEEALKFALDLRNHVAEACWLLAVGDAQQALGDHGAALTAYNRSATLHRRLGDRSREALAWHGTGETYRRLGRPDEAAAFHRRAAAAYRELGDAWGEAVALDGLAHAVREQDEPERDERERDGRGEQAAREHWAACLRLLDGYDDARARRMRTEVQARLDQG